MSYLISYCLVLSCPVSSLATTLRQPPTPPRCVHTPSARGHTRGDGVGTTPCVVVRIMVRMVMVVRMLVCVYTVMLKVILWERSRKMKDRQRDEMKSQEKYESAWVELQWESIDCAERVQLSCAVCDVHSVPQCVVRRLSDVREWSGQLWVCWRCTARW